MDYLGVAGWGRVDGKEIVNDVTFLKFFLRAQHCSGYLTYAILKERSLSPFL